MKKIKINHKVFISVSILIIVILFFTYANIVKGYVEKNNFADVAIKTSEKNENTIFSIEKMYLCSSANVKDNSVEKNLQDLSMYQYADIAIYIKNNNHSDELTNENTIKKLYIDNISFESNSQMGEKSLNYTNSLTFGKNTDIDTINSTDKIDFDILNTNDENQSSDYSNPTFYADCSNPITLKYVNKNIIQGYKMDKNTSLAFNGKLLEKAGVSLDELKCKIKFRINIINNNDDCYSCWLNFDIPLDGLYTEGVIIKSANTQGSKYNFFWQPKEEDVSKYKDFI